MPELKFVFPLALLLAIRLAALADDPASLIERAQSLIRRTEGKVFGELQSPRWLEEGRRLVYRVTTASGHKQYVLVDTATGELRRGASPAALGLAESDRISTSAQPSLKPRRTQHNGPPAVLRIQNTTAESVELYWVNSEGERRSYGRVRPGDTRELSTYQGHVWLLCDRVGTPLGFYEAKADSLEILVDGKPAKPATAPQKKNKPGQSPDGKWSIRFENHNVLLISAEGQTTPLTTEGTAQIPYLAPIFWSPDSQYCVVMRVAEFPRRIVTVVDSSPAGQVQPKLLTYDYFKPGDNLPQGRPALINVAAKKLTLIPDELFQNAFSERGDLAIRWSPRGDEFYFDFNQRGHQLYRILAVKPASGAIRTVVEERSATFIEWNQKTWRHWVDDTGELLWMSERDGWTHLWLYDIATGKVKNQITRGSWVVRQVLHVDAGKRQIWFMASGVRPNEDPYFRHLCRVNFDGSGFIQLT